MRSEAGRLTCSAEWVPRDASSDEILVAASGGASEALPPHTRECVHGRDGCGRTAGRREAGTTFYTKKRDGKKRRASCRHTGETRRRATAPLPPGSLLYVFVTLSVWLLGDLRDVPSEIPRLRKRPRAAVADRALLPFVPGGRQ